MRIALILVALALGVGCRTGAVRVPEPLVFDLVRGLGAEKGELEVNALGTLPLSGGDPIAPLFAPEVEYAVIDGLAFEFELPFEEEGLASVKLAGQWTFGADLEAGFIHGTQILAERWTDEDAWDLTAIYIPAYRFDEQWSLLGMFGATSVFGPDVEDNLGAVANLNLFADLDEHWVAGLELDGTFFDDGTSVLIMPQLHHEFSELFTLQFGVGVLYYDGKALGPGIVPPHEAASGWFPQISLRAIFEF